MLCISTILDTATDFTPWLNNRLCTMKKMTLLREKSLLLRSRIIMNSAKLKRDMVLELKPWEMMRWKRMTNYRNSKLQRFWRSTNTPNMPRKQRKQRRASIIPLRNIIAKVLISTQLLQLSMQKLMLLLLRVHQPLTKVVRWALMISPRDSRRVDMILLRLSSKVTIINIIKENIILCQSTSHNIW